jgi:hypothetical protein
VEIGRSSVIWGMKRTVIVFFGLAAIVFVIDQFSRKVLGLDCIGMVLPAWGCVAEPYPTTFAAAGDMSGSILTYGGLLGGGLLAAFMLRDLVFSGAGYLLARFRPDLVKKLAGAEEEPRSYRVR